MEHLTASEPGVDLYWLPLGAGGHSVRLNGRVFEAVAARLDRRPPCDLYHSALEVRVPEGRFVIEMAPVPDGNGEQRGVVAEGAVGSRWAGRVRIFRYEVRRWREGVIPDIHEAVESPRHLSADQDLAQRVLDLALQVPTPVWGRDELGAGEMWNSNSLICWLLARCGLPAESIDAPAGGRPPGWHAGLVVARRQSQLRRVRRPAYTPSAMPIYEFVCMECESHFEELVGMTAPDPACPDCGASRVARQLSVFAAHGAPGTAEQSIPSPSFGGGGGGCCGGACGC